MNIPLGLRHALETGQCVLFIGSGTGKYVKNKIGNNAPIGIELANLLIDHFQLNIDYNIPLAEVAELVEIRKGRKELENFIKITFSDLVPDDNLKWLFSQRWKAIYTTNYDNAIQKTYGLLDNPLQNPVIISSTAELKSYEPFFEVPIYHLHGTLFGEASPQIIITLNDYAKFQYRRKMLFEKLKNDFATSTMLYVGYSNRDPNWRTVFEEMKTEFYPSKTPLSYRITPDKDAISIEILKAANVETINCTLEDFVTMAKMELTTIKVDNKTLAKIKEKVPTDLIAAFDKNPSPMIRLLRSWTYVNQADFNTQSNLKQFLNGDRPNWALIANKEYFERDVEEQIYDSLIDYLTSSSTHPNVHILLGSAGYGITTVLMILAAKLVKDRIGSIFMHIEGTDFNEGDIEYASSLFNEKPIFFIDNAADSIDQINSIVQRFRESGKSGLFILGERFNEWKQTHSKMVGKEFEIAELSHPEITRLISFLENNNYLNQLENLPQELRISTIKDKHNKQLLVVMKESTEGKSFDAILEDEFRGINNDIAKKLYLIVSCFYQHGAQVRDKLLADLLNIDIVEMYKNTSDNLDGIVIYDSIESGDGFYTARARHRLIAAIVWERCGGSYNRDNLIQSVIESLNLTYKLDRVAFEDFIKSDRIVDSLSSFEGKTKYFETACRIDPSNPYVRQHYSRMLNRSGKPELAISQIDEAIRLDPKARILQHTKGKILADLALSNESKEVGRRRLAQSESCFKMGISMYDKDDYSYQGLAELYLDWARKIEDDQERIDYISKAEEVISDGLKKVKFKDGLWIISSNIQKFLGNPTFIEAMEKAVIANPASIFARYCLGRAYRKLNNFEKAKEVLYPLIKNNTEEYRAFIEYALSQIDNNEPRKSAIAILEISSLYGYSDAKYISLLGGLQFLEGRLTAADKTFNEHLRHPFSAQELNKILFKPKDNNGNPLRIQGKVVKVGAGYALIENSSYPVFLCPGSKFNGLLLKDGMNISFEIAFCPKGSIADKPLEIS